MAKTVALTLLVLAVVILVLEGTARVGMFLADGRNPYHLVYGFVPDVNRNSVQYAGYTKFPPNAVRRQSTPEGIVDMQINSDGFRGLRDFERPKPPGVVRIATIGASSTFGYYNHDDETYPFVLEQFLREAHPDMKIEVLNLGIPGFRMENILAMARNELPELQPDIVTLYTGANNATRHRAPEEANALYRGKTWLAFHSVAYRQLLSPFAKAAYYRLARAFNKDLGGVPNLGLPVLLSEHDVGELRSSLAKEFRVSVEELADLVESLGASFVLITETFAPFRLGPNPIWKLSTYDEEVSEIEAMLVQDGEVPAPQATALIHRDLMNELRSIASERGLPIVEGIEVIDEDREHFVATWVHLTAEGNRKLARAIQETIDAHNLLQPGDGLPTGAGDTLHVTR